MKNKANNRDKLPKWLDPVLDSDGDVKGYKILKPALADAVIDQFWTTAFTGGKKADMYDYDKSAGIWQWVNNDSIKHDVGAVIMTGCADCHVDLGDLNLTAKIIDDTAKLVKIKAPVERMEDTFTRLETDEELSVILVKTTTG